MFFKMLWRYADIVFIQRHIRNPVVPQDDGATKYAGLQPAGKRFCCFDTRDSH
jgi:hypothetical protein